MPPAVNGNNPKNVRGPHKTEGYSEMMSEFERREKMNSPKEELVEDRRSDEKMKESHERRLENELREN